MRAVIFYLYLPGEIEVFACERKAGRKPNQILSARHLGQVARDRHRAFFAFNTRRKSS
jgi:hypothetical protein